MPSNLKTNILVVAVGGNSIDVVPPAGQEWLVTDFFSDALFITDVPDIQVSLYDGASVCISLMDPFTDPGKRTRQYQFYITNTIYLRLKNTAGAGANLGFIGERVKAGLTVSAVVTVGAGAGGAVDIIPPPGQTLKITEWGAVAWTVLPAVDINPNVEIGLTDGTFVDSRIVLPLDVRGQDKQPEIYISDMVYLHVFSTPGTDFAYCGRRVPETCISSIVDIDGAGITPYYDVRPPPGDEWVVTEIGAEGAVWAGAGAPADYPDVLVQLMVAANLSTIMEAGSVATSLRWNSDCRLKIDHDHWVRITDVSGGFNEVCVSGYKQRGY